MITAVVDQGPRIGKRAPRLELALSALGGSTPADPNHHIFVWEKQVHSPPKEDRRQRVFDSSPELSLCCFKPTLNLLQRSEHPVLKAPSSDLR
jgi:hypothetical protein